MIPVSPRLLPVALSDGRVRRGEAREAGEVAVRSPEGSYRRRSTATALVGGLAEALPVPFTEVGLQPPAAEADVAELEARPAPPLAQYLTQAHLDQRPQGRLLAPSHRPGLPGERVRDLYCGLHTVNHIVETAFQTME